MAMATIISASIISKPFLIWTLQVPKSCISNAQAAPLRRSGNYQPSIWEYTQIQSLKNQYSGEKFIRRRDELKMEVKIMLSDRNMKPLDQLEIIDLLQRLGLSYNFEDEIYSILNYVCDKSSKSNGDLYAKALSFRLLRQHGFNVSQEIFDGLSETHTEDTKGMQYLYEASFLATEGESELEQTRNWSEKQLREYLENKNIDQNVAELVHHALELPLHWKMLRLEARWFINFYKKRQDMIPLLLELAILDFNVVQAAHIEDLKYVARWWKETGLAENLPFARDRLVENFFWTIGVNFLPKYGYFRRIATKWRDLCKSYLREAKWYFSQYIPTMEEYMDNAWISISAPVILVHAYFLIANPVNKEDLHYLKNYHDIIRWSALILRLANDLGTSSEELKRGDVPKSIQCYMNEKKVSEEDAHQHIRLLISETWKKLNEAHNVAAHPFPKMFIWSAMNLARMAQCMYQHGDGHGGHNSETKNHIMALLFESIPPAHQQKTFSNI
nr:(-)-alpha-terpineol synthase-like isoform X2 [Nicotiana tomentosiformis]